MRWRPLAACLVVAALGLGASGPAAAQPAKSSAKGTSSKGSAAKSAGKSSKRAAPPAKRSGKKGGKQKPKAPRQKGSAPGTPDPHARASVTAGATTEPGPAVEVEELNALDPVLFPDLLPEAPKPWARKDGPSISASGMPAPSRGGAVAKPALPAATAPADLAWLESLEKPDIPFRWDPRVVRYLEFYRSSPKGRAMATAFLKKFGRYGESIRRVLRRHGIPEDIAWLSMMESAFNPTAQSPAGAAGLWQFTPKGAQAYGLRIDRWVDERLDPERSTDAAARYLSDLNRRFGRWELAFAAYNMGYGGLLTSIRKYNTNDFWELCRLEAGLPLETALYVPKIIAIAIVARNPAAFGLKDLVPDAPETFEVATVGSGVSLAAVAISSGADLPTLRRMNPQLLEGTTPPSSDGPSAFAVRVPVGLASKLEGRSLERVGAPNTERRVVRWGESLEYIADDQGTTESKIRRLNGISHTIPLRPGTVLFVPRHEAMAKRPAEEQEAVVVSRVPPALPGKRHVLYEVVWGDRLPEVARALGVAVDDLCQWNAIDATAQLHGRMVLQAFVDPRERLDDVLVREPKEVHLLVAGSPEFFEHVEGKKGRQRIKVTVGRGDSFKSIAKRYDLSLGMLERINHRSRWDAVVPGETLVVYAKESKVAPKPSLDPYEDDGVAGARTSADGATERVD